MIPGPSRERGAAGLRGRALRSARPRRGWGRAPPPAPPLPGAIPGDTGASRAPAAPRVPTAGSGRCPRSLSALQRGVLVPREKIQELEKNGLQPGRWRSGPERVRDTGNFEQLLTGPVDLETSALITSEDKRCATVRSRRGVFFRSIICQRQGGE